VQAGGDDRLRHESASLTGVDCVPVSGGGDGRQPKACDPNLGMDGRWTQLLDASVDRAARGVLGVGEHLALMIAAEIGDVSRFPTPRKLIGFAGLAPRVAQSGQSSRTGALSKAGPRTLRWAAIEAAQSAWRPTNPWNRLYLDVKHRTGKSNPAKSAVARKVLIAAWHVLARQEPFRPSRAERGNSPVPASSHFHRPPDGPRRN